VHNRWHPAIAPALKVNSGDEVWLDTIDALDRQIKPHTLPPTRPTGI
jgi:formamidase